MAEQGDAFIYVALHEHNEAVAMRQHDLPQDSDDVLNLLSSEAAPLLCWFDTAKAYLSQNQAAAFVNIVQEAHSPDVLQVRAAQQLLIMLACRKTYACVCWWPAHTALSCIPTQKSNSRHHVLLLYHLLWLLSTIDSTRHNQSGFKQHHTNTTHHATRSPFSTVTYLAVPRHHTHSCYCCCPAGHPRVL
jgi:hypothetical protein